MGDSKEDIIKLKRICDKAIEFNKQIIKFVDKGTSLVGLTTWEKYGELRAAIFDYKPELRKGHGM